MCDVNPDNESQITLNENNICYRMHTAILIYSQL